MQILLKADLFSSERDTPRTRKSILHLLEAWVELNRVWLRFHPETPALYNAGVKYKRDSRPMGPDGEKVEQWLIAPEVMKNGGSDCKNLAAWRVAELRNKNVICRPFLKWKKFVKNNTTMYHVLVQYPLGFTPEGWPLWEDKASGLSGRMEDPSKVLGMGKEDDVS